MPLDPLTNLPQEETLKVPKFNLPPFQSWELRAGFRPIESKYDVGTFAGQDLEEVRAQRQGVGEELMYTAARMVTLTGTKILSGVSSVGEFIVNTGRAINQGSLDPYYDTPVTDKVNKVEEMIKKSMPLYNEPGDRDKNIFVRAFTDKEFWMDDIASEAVPFLASAYLTGYGTTKLLQPLSNSLYASRLTNATKLGLQEISAMEAAGAAPELIQEVKAANALRQFGLAETKNNFNKLVTAGMSRTVESLAEGAQTKKQVFDALIEKGYSVSEAKEKAGLAALTVAGMNMLLAPLDYDQYSGWFKTFSKSRDALTKGASFGSSFLKHAGRNAFTEGILEEGLQNAMQEYAQKKYTGGYDDEHLSPLLGVMSEYFKGFTTKEGWDAMGTGAIVGGLFGGITGAYGDKSQSERYDNLKALIANNDYLKENFSSFIKEDPKTGQPVINEAKILSMFQQMGSDGLLSDAMITQLTNNYEEAYKTIDNMRFANWAFTHFEAGEGESLMKKIEDLGNLSMEELQEQGLSGNDMRNSEGKLVTPKEVSQRYMEKAIAYEKLYNQVSSRFDLPHRAALKNVFDEAVLQKETSVSLDKINRKIANLQADVNSRNMSMAGGEFIDVVEPGTPKSIDEQELEVLKNRKQDLINTLRESYVRLDDWTNPEKLAAKEKAMKEAQEILTKDAKSSKLADKISRDPNYKMSKEESKFYAQNKEDVDKKVTKTPEEVKKTEDKSKPSEPIKKVGKIQKFGQPGELQYSKIRYEDGFPVYSVTNPDGTVSEYSAKEGWGAVDITETELEESKEVLRGGKNHFSNLFKYRLSAEKNLMKNVRAKVQKEDGSFYSEEELIEKYPEAFPSLKADQVTKKVMKRSDWQNFIQFKVDKKYTPGEPFKLKSGLYGNRSPLDFVVSVTDPETGEIHEVHHVENPYFYGYQTSDGNIQLVDFSNITLDQFNSAFALGYGKQALATQKDLDVIKQQWFDLKQFYDKVNDWYVSNGLQGSQQIPAEWYTMAPSAALDVIEDPNQPLTPLTSVPAFADAPIVSAYDYSSVNGKLTDPEAPDIPETVFLNAYFTYFKDANGFKTWVRVTPKKVLSGQEVTDRINTAVKKLYEINPDIVGTPEGDAAAEAIISELGVYIAAGAKDGFLPKVEFSAFRPEGKFRYFLQIQSAIKTDQGKQRGRLIFEDKESNPITFETDALLNEFLYSKREKIGGTLLNTKNSFRQSIPKGIVDPAAAELFDLITSPNVVRDYTIRFNFGNTLPVGDAMGLANFKATKAVKVDPKNNEVEALQKEIDNINAQLASGKLSEKDARNLANKKVNLQNKIQKLTKESPIDVDPSFIMGSEKHLDYTIQDALSDYVGELMTLDKSYALNPQKLSELLGSVDADSQESVVQFLENEAKSSNSIRSKIANTILNKLNGFLPKVKSSNATIKPIDPTAPVESTFLFDVEDENLAIKAKKADIERRRQAELLETNYISNRTIESLLPKFGYNPNDFLDKNNEYKIEKLDEVFDDIANKINAKYDAELAALESQTKPVKKDSVDKIVETIEKEKSTTGKTIQVTTSSGRVITLKTPEGDLANIESETSETPDLGPVDIDVEDLESKVKSEQEKIAEKVAKKNSGKGISFKDAGDKVGYIAPSEPWTVEQAANWLKRILPSGISVEEIAPLMTRLSSGRLRFGYFKDNVIALTNNAPRTLAFHEAFHAIFRSVLLPGDRSKFINIIRKELDYTPQQIAIKVAELRATNPENYANLSDLEVEDRVYEEEIADRYADWQNERLAYKNIFQKLFQFLQKVIDFFRGEHSLDALFRKIERGGFTKSNVNPGFKESADKVLGLLSPMKSQEVVFNVAGAYFNKRENGISTNLEDVMDDHKRMYDPLRPENVKMLEERPDLFEALNNLYYVYSDPQERTVIKEQVQMIIERSNYNPFLIDQQEFEGDSEANGGSETERVHDKPVQEYDPFDKIGAEVKRFFGTTTYETLDQFGNKVIRSLDPRNIYARLLPQLSASHVRREHMMAKLESLAQSDDQTLKAVYNRLVKVTGVSEETPNGIGDGELFLNRFKMAFDVYQYKSTQVIVNPGKSSYVLYVNKTDLGKYAFERWENDFRQYVLPRLKDIKFRDDVVNNGLNKALRYWDSDPARAADFLRQSLDKLGIHPDLDYIRRSLNMPGMTTDKELFKDIPFISKDFVTALKNAVNTGTDIFNKEEENSLVTRLKAIALGNAHFDGNIIMPNYRTPEGNLSYSYAEGNFVMESARDMNTNARSIEWIRSQMKDPRFKNNVILSNGTTQEAREVFAQAILTNVEVAITGSIKDETTGKGVSTRNLDSQSAQMNYLGMFSTMRKVPYGDKGNFTQTQYWLTQVAEKNNQIAAALPRMEYVIKDENGNMVITSAAQDHLYKMFLQEQERIQHVQEGNRLGYLNGGRVYFPYLEGIKAGEKNSIVEQILYGLHDSKGVPNGQGLIRIIENYYNDEIVANKLNVAIDPTILKDLYKGDEKAFIADLIINDFIWTNSYLQLMGMDLGVAKSFEDFVKRAAMMIASGPQLNSSDSIHVISYTQENIEYVDKNTFERLEGNQRNNPNAAPIKTSDAQVYSIPESVLLDLRFQGKIDDKTIKAFKRLINPIETFTDEQGNQTRVYVPLTAEEQSLIDLIPKKEVIGGVSLDGKTVYQKMAVGFLTKDFTSIWDGEKWVARQGYEELHNKREHLEKIFNDNGGKSTVHLAPLSASKLYFPGDALESKAFENPDAIGKGPVTNITNNHRREQVINATKNNDSMIYSLQQHAISGSELLDSQGRGLKSMQEKAFAALRNDAFEFAANLIRVKNSDGSFSKADLEIFLENLRNQVLATTPDSQIFEFLKSDGQGNFKYSPDLVHVTAKFESLFLSTFKEAFRNKIAGRKATLMSDQGIPVLVKVSKDSEGKEIEERIVTRIEQEQSGNQVQYLDSSTYKPRKLKFMELITDENGNNVIKPAEIMMTRKRAELLGINITDPSKANYMRVISTRIPTQNYHSIMPAVIVDFLPEYYGDTVVGPMELVLMMGADFDVDALYTYMQDFWIKDGVTIKYGEETTSQDKYEAYKYWHLNNNKILNDQIDKRISSDPEVERVKTFLNAKKDLDTLNKETREAIKKNLELLKENNPEKGDPIFIGKVITDLSQKLLEIKMESGDIRTLLLGLSDLSSLYEKHTQDAMRSLGMPGTFQEWQAKGSPVSRGELYNNLFEINYKMLTQGSLWEAYKQYLNTDSIDNAIAKVDENPANKVETLKLGNSIPSKAAAFKVNSASTPLRGIIVTSNVAGMFMREKGVRLKKGIDFVDADGNHLTYFEFPSVNTEASVEEIQEKLKQIRNISDTGSQMVGLVIDDPKEPKLYKLNWSLHTLPAIADAISLGMPRDFVFKMFALPVFKQIDKSITRKTRAIAPEEGGKSKAINEIEGVYEKFSRTISGILQATKKFTKEEAEALSNEMTAPMDGKLIDEALVYNPKTSLLDISGRMFTDANLTKQFSMLSVEDITKELRYYSANKQAIKIFKELASNSQYRAGTLSPISSLNRQVGSSLEDVNGMIEAIELLDDTEASPFENLKEAVYSSENLSNNIAKIKEVRDYTEMYFIKQTPFFKAFSTSVKRILKPWLTLAEKEQVSRHSISALISHAINTATGNKDFMFLLENGGKDSIVSMYKELQSIPEFKENPLIKWAFPKVYDANDKTTYYPIDTLKFDTFTKLDPILSERLIDGHTSLLNSSNERIAKFGRNLFWYAFAKDGLMFKSEAATKFLTPESFLPVADAFKDIHERAGDNFRELISEYFDESFDQISDRFTENFLRHRGLQRFVNFTSSSSLRKFNPTGKKELDLFKVVINSDLVTLEYSGLGTPAQANEHLSQKNIPIEVISGIPEAQVSYPDFFALSVAQGFDLSPIKYRLKLQSVKEGVATYKVLKPFGDYEMTISPFPRSPKENEEMYNKFSKSSGRVGPEIDPDFGGMPLNYVPSDADTGPMSDYTEFSGDDMDSFKGFDNFSETDSYSAMQEFLNAPEILDELKESTQGLKKFERSGKPATSFNKVLEGDIFALPGIPVITTNLGGVHGAGLAAAAKAKGLIQQGDGLFKATDKVVQLPVKLKWSDSMAMNNNMLLLNDSLNGLINVAKANPSKTYLLPLAGLGHGEGKVEEIMPMLIRTIESADNIKLVLPAQGVSLGRQGTVRKDATRENMPKIKEALKKAGLLAEVKKDDDFNPNDISTKCKS